MAEKPKPPKPPKPQPVHVRRETAATKPQQESKRAAPKENKHE